MNSRRIGFSEIPLTATLTLANVLDVLRFDDGSIEVHAGETHVASWTQKGGWKAGKELPASKRETP